MRWRSSSHQWTGGARQLSSTAIWQAEVTLFQADHDMYSWELITGLSYYVYFPPFGSFCWLYLFIYYYIWRLVVHRPLITSEQSRDGIPSPCRWPEAIFISVTFIGSQTYIWIFIMNHIQFTKKIFCLHLWFY